MTQAATRTLTEFLLARIAEDEEWGRTEAEGWSGHLNDPARVLAECEAKRRIVEEHAPFQHEIAAPGVWCRMCFAPSGWPATSSESGVRYPCLTLRALALPYADHPDYREEWQV